MSGAVLCVLGIRLNQLCEVVRELRQLLRQQADLAVDVIHVRLHQMQHVRDHFARTALQTYSTVEYSIV